MWVKMFSGDSGGRSVGTVFLRLGMVAVLVGAMVGDVGAVSPTAGSGGGLRSLKVIGTSTLGRDPPTVNRLNGESFQQDALVTFNGYQYAVFYDADTSVNASVRFVSVARRVLGVNAGSGTLGQNGEWEKFTLKDYNQTQDDGHNVISLGISRGDGTLHIGFDQHDNDLRYRISKQGVATKPSSAKWSADLFGPVMDSLPGLTSLNKSEFFVNVTYPRFLMIPESAQRLSSSTADLLLELRVGRSGLGDDWLYTYKGGRWTQVGKYLEGVNNNAYINGLDFDANGALQVTWTYRDFINDTGKDVAVQAGPNGPENNHDMDFALSRDLGRTWLNNWNQTIANLVRGDPILPISPGITIFSIPKFGGILNQEAQTVDSAGRIHVLNRENGTNVEQWYHYWRDTNNFWTRSPFPLDLASINNVTNTPTVIGKRGKLLSYQDTLLAILPSNAPNSTALSILTSTAQRQFADWTVVWEASSGCAAEPLFDRYRAVDGVLSLFVVNGTRVEVVDIDLKSL